MPEKDGKLTPAEMDKLKNWVTTKVKIHNCPSCGSNNWALGPHLLNGMIHYPGGNVVIGGETYPMAFVVCNVCAYTRHFMAVPIGLSVPSRGGSDG